jgi:hypothetical protein
VIAARLSSDEPSSESAQTIPAPPRYSEHRRSSSRMSSSGWPGQPPSRSVDSASATIARIAARAPAGSHSRSASGSRSSARHSIRLHIIQRNREIALRSPGGVGRRARQVRDPHAEVARPDRLPLGPGVQRLAAAPADRARRTAEAPSATDEIFWRTRRCSSHPRAGFLVEEGHCRSSVRLPQGSKSSAVPSSESSWSPTPRSEARAGPAASAAAACWPVSRTAGSPGPAGRDAERRGRSRDGHSRCR